MYRAVFSATVFDYNGVIVNDEHVHLAAFNDVLANFGVRLSVDEYFERYVGFDDMGGFAAVLSDAGHDVPHERIRELVEAKRPRYLERAKDELKFFKGARELLVQQADLGIVGIVSGALRAEIELGLERLGVRERIAWIVSAEDTSRCKPDPQGYEIGVRELATELANPADEAFVIEDSLDGVHAAKAASFRCVGVAHHCGAEALRGAGADWIVASLAEITRESLEGFYAGKAGAEYPGVK